MHLCLKATAKGRSWCHPGSQRLPFVPAQRGQAEPLEYPRYQNRAQMGLKWCQVLVIFAVVFSLSLHAMLSINISAICCAWRASTGHNIQSSQRASNLLKNVVSDSPGGFLEAPPSFSVLKIIAFYSHRSRGYGKKAVTIWIKRKHIEIWGLLLLCMLIQVKENFKGWYLHYRCQRELNSTGNDGNTYLKSVKRSLQCQCTCREDKQDGVLLQAVLGLCV